MSEKKTIYHKLNDFMSADMGFIPPEQKTKVILKGTSPDDIKLKALELQQKNKIQDKFFKTVDHGFQKAMQYEAARLPAYLDYEGMEYYPIIASALDLFMEESTTIGVNGKMLNIYSNKDRIKDELEDLFYNIINVNVNLPFWSRNVCKYGDNFVNIYGEKNKGIISVKQMVNYEIERIERINMGKPTVKFRQRDLSTEFNIFEMAHFRLLGDDKYIPYGSSLLNKIRRVFRQLIMAEDAMLTYRIIRAGEKRVFKIDVGNIDDDDIEAYIQKVASKFKKQPSINPNDGQIDYRFNMLSNDEDYFLPVRNNNSATGIDTLRGAENLDAIADIEYLRDNLFTGLGIPKPFLGFQDSAGEGKNLAQMDIRFAKKVNRIQQALIQELNKIAIIHLYLRGFDERDINNFTLALTNPSTQEDLLKTELLQSKAQVYTEVTRNDNMGIAAMSHTKAKKLIFNMSDKDIIDDLKIQRMERAISQELQDTPLVIRNTTLFNDVDKKFSKNEPIVAHEQGGMDDELGGDTPFDGGGSGAFQSINDLPPVEGAAEGKISKKDTINELGNELNNQQKPNKGDIKKEVINETNEKNKSLNFDANMMIKEIDKLLKESDNELFHNGNDAIIVIDEINLDLDDVNIE